MKVIDMLQKIANGEEVRFKILSDDDIYHCYRYDTLFNETARKEVNWCIDEEWLNSEVAIIEDKKIGKYDTGLDNGSWNEESVKKGILEKNNIEDYLVRVMEEVDNVKFKVFEIIDKLNEVEK